MDIVVIAVALCRCRQMVRQWSLIAQVKTSLVGAAKVVGHGFSKGFVLDLIGRKVRLLHHYVAAVVKVGTGIEALVVLVAQFYITHTAGL